jgi:Sec-independent protein translocase protein TatA
MMQWTTLLATLLGAVVAMGTSLLVEARKDHRELLLESRKHKRDVTSEWRKTRRDLYAGFLAVLTQARSELRHLSENPEMPEAERTQMVRRAFARCYELRYQLELFAPAEVVNPALAYFRCVRSFRNAVGRGMRHTDQEFERHAEQMKDTLADARNAMRKDLELSETAGDGN